MLSVYESTELCCRTPTYRWLGIARHLTAHRSAPTATGQPGRTSRQPTSSSRIDKQSHLRITSSHSSTMSNGTAVESTPVLSEQYKAGIQRPMGINPHPSACEPGSTLIKTIESFYVRPRWLFVRIETRGGVVGWGEGTLEGHTEAVQGSLRDISRR